ncbi:hypothetical protein QUB10_25815, partial [Microcoleus sp. B5-D4]
MLKIYEYSLSGNCYKIRLLLTQLNIPCERREIDIIKGESRTTEFLGSDKYVVIRYSFAQNIVVMMNKIPN